MRRCPAKTRAAPSVEPMDLRNHLGERLDHAFTPGRAGSRQLVVIGHGVTSHHDRPWLVALALVLADAGLASLRFSFAGNGKSEGSFEAATIGKEVDDLKSVVDALAGRELAYVGHSMGAAVGVLAAAGEPRLRALVSLAGITHLQAFVTRHFAHLVPGDLMFGKPGCPLAAAFLADAARIGSTLGAAARIAAPWLLVHGDQDELVPLQDSRDAQAACPQRAELLVLPGADHRFTGRHEDLCAAVVPWLQKTLGAPRR